MINNNTTPIIALKNIRVQFGEQWVHKDLNLSIQRDEIFAIVGGTGSGKTTLLREMLLLQRPDSGSICVFDQELMTATPQQLLAVQQRWGVMFQHNALFSSLTVLENVAFPLHEHTQLDSTTINELALLKILAAGLPADAAIKYPAELSGGMQKRAALARAIVLDPELLFLDEPTAGLDPEGAAAFDELVLNLRATLGLTIVMITHDLDSLWRTADRVAFLGEKKVLAVDAPAQLAQNPQPIIQQYFSGPRGRVVQEAYGIQR
jgi:phospholipid/cholesterol/gamma-HCH transport system ATP-binding protein